MIVEFSCKNFRSIKELQTISFAATGLKSSKENVHVDKDNIVQIGDTSLFKTVGIYGANASGKSNMVKSLHAFLLYSGHGSGYATPFMDLLLDPFLYQDKPEDSEVYFQIVLLIGGSKYRYGFTIKKKKDTSQDNLTWQKVFVANEWLYGPKVKNQVELFTRTMNSVSNKMLAPERIPSLQSEQTLFLAHAAAFDENNICHKIQSVLKSYLRGMDRNFTSWNFPLDLIFNEPSQKHVLLTFLRAFDLDYDNVFWDVQSHGDSVGQYEKVNFTKRYVNDLSEVREITLNLAHTESSGTRKLYDFAGALIVAFTARQSFFIIDEIDSNFHPSLLHKMLLMFNDPKINKQNSQLLFTSHDTSLMSPSIMRRDQFYFTEKIEDNATELYSLSDLKGIRNNADFARQYLAGLYGALPKLQELVISEIERQ